MSIKGPYSLQLKKRGTKELFFDKSYMVMREIMDCYQARVDAGAHDYFVIDNVGDLLALMDGARVKTLKGKV